MGTVLLAGIDPSFLWALPFVGFLLALAIIPLLYGDFWHRHDWKIALVAIVCVVIPMGTHMGLKTVFGLVSHTLIHEYIPFLLMISCLFVISGGIHLTTTGHATPLTNVGILFLSGLLASIIGTTGASMLLIRPFINLNHDRRHKAYLVIFFIFIVSNLGGCLSPVGDPPLFLGFLEGVDFLWPLKHLFAPYMAVVIPLLVLFFFIDRYHHYHHKNISPDQGELKKFKIYGKRNFIFLILVLGVFLLTGMDIERYHIVRDAGVLFIAIASYFLTPKNVHHMNRFHLDPIKEVGIVFIAIFITLIPISGMIHGGREGLFGGLLAFANPGGLSDPLRYFFLSGGLSAFLDNAPTYLLFFQMAGGDASFLMGPGVKILMAISLGSVFMGAMTYIGNAPNFMVKSIAEKHHIKMPSFFGYMMWSVGLLLPILTVFGILYFR